MAPCALGISAVALYAFVQIVSIGAARAAGHPSGARVLPSPFDGAARRADADVGRHRGRPLCLYVSSYHRGYSWSDGVERGLREGIGERCELVQFDMDTKRRRAPEEMASAVASALGMIAELRPDVVITSDDNAARHLIVPHLAGGDTPVVFCGINWTVEEYGFPTPSVTGIVEIAPIEPMIREALRIVPEGRRAAYIGGRTLTEHKNYERIAEVAATLGVTLDELFFEDLAGWKRAHDAAQDYDFVVMGSYSGVEGWDQEAAAAHALANARRPSFTNHDWMMPVTTVGYTKIPEEHGERAAAIALAILDGTAARDIPLLVNRQWDTWLNPALAAAIETPIPERLARRAKQVAELP